MAQVKFDLLASAREEMIREGFQPGFPPEVQAQLRTMGPEPSVEDLRDLRSLPWSSIDNSSSKDLDQIEYAEEVPEGTRVLVAIADVDARVGRDSAIDRYARGETTSVYVPGHVFPMLPEELSTDLTSLAPQQDRAALVIEFVVNKPGEIGASQVYRARVRNHCQLAYGGVGPWLEGRGRVPDEIANDIPMQDQLRIQEEVTGRLRENRHRLGALQFDRVEAVPIIEDGQVQRIEARAKNRAADLIEDLMVAANEVMAQTLARAGVPGIRRVVRTPERWPRIVQLASEHGGHLPNQPDSGALSDFLRQQKLVRPGAYPEISLAVLKLMGPGEYLVSGPGDPPLGHFGLAAHDYTHSTAPNRRFADLVTQRLIKAVLEGGAQPYTPNELNEIARTCTLKEDAARKVERAMQKRAAAYALRSRVGQTFRAIVTGVNDRGTFVRVLDPPVEGRVMRGERGLDVGDRVKLSLLKVDPQRGFIDFGR